MIDRGMLAGLPQIIGKSLNFKKWLNLTNGTGAELLTNGTFTGGSTGWTLAAGWTYGSNAVAKDGDGTGTLAEDAFAAVVGEVYLLSYVISSWTVGTVTPSVGGASGAAVGANGTYRVFLRASSTAGLSFAPTNTARFTIDTISLKKVATQLADQVAVWVEDQGGTAGKATLYVRGENGTVVGIGGDGFTFGANDEDLTVAYAANTLTLAGGVLVTPSGSVSAPPLGIGAANTGLYSAAGGYLDVTISATRVAAFTTAGFLFMTNAASFIQFGANQDAILGWEAAARIQQGEDSATPVAQIFKGPDARAGTDTNTVGGPLTIAPGRSTGTAAGGDLYFATSPKGATGTAANALVNRVQVDFEGIAGFSPQDAAATPVEPTAPLKLFAHNKSVADDAVVTLPSVTTCGHGTVHVGGGDPGTAGFPFTNFFVDGSGNVVLLDPTLSADVSANLDTDGDLCIGTADPQEPVQVKNRLAGTKVLNIMFWYD